MRSREFFAAILTAALVNGGCASHKRSEHGIAASSHRAEKPGAVAACAAHLPKPAIVAASSSHAAGAVTG